MRRLDTTHADFDSALAQLTAVDTESDSVISQTVAQIIADVAARGDEALLEYTARFDQRKVASVGQLEISKERQITALNSVDSAQREACLLYTSPSPRD